MLGFHSFSNKNRPKLDPKRNKKVVVFTENRLKIGRHSFHEKGNPYHFFFEHRELICVKIYTGKVNTYHSLTSYCRIL